jgi:hypothetical protein
MKQPFIKLYENVNGDIVITYIGDASFGDLVEPQVLVIEPEDVERVSDLMVKFHDEVTNG